VFDLQGKGSSGVGVGRGRASTMQAKVIKLSIMQEIFVWRCCAFNWY